MNVKLETPNASEIYYVTWKELPLCCPTPQMRLWDSHQRVYLAIHEGGRAECPYCGAVYILLDPSLEGPQATPDNVEIEHLYHEKRTQVRDDRELNEANATENSAMTATSTADTPAERAARDRHFDSVLDEALMESFPASDSVAISAPKSSDTTRPVKTVTRKNTATSPGK
jgi:uncharacterized Zn-finger protein